MEFRKRSKIERRRKRGDEETRRRGDEETIIKELKHVPLLEVI
jgi:hypothetical protein